jgi:hypothetical protein
MSAFGFQKPAGVHFGSNIARQAEASRLGLSFTESESVMEHLIHIAARIPWNKGKLVGQKATLKLKDIWAIRVRLQIGHRTRELALFNLAIDRKLRSCDLVALRVRDVCHGRLVAKRAIVIQQKMQRPVQFEITEQTREALEAWIQTLGLHADDYLFSEPNSSVPTPLHATVCSDRPQLGSARSVSARAPTALIR